MEVKSKVWIEKDGKLIFGEGKAALLAHIKNTGSIKKAAQLMGISFRHAWGYIDAIERRLGKKMLVRKRGGKYGGGSELTEEARELIKRFQKLNKYVKKYTDEKFKKLFGRI